MSRRRRNLFVIVGFVLPFLSMACSSTGGTPAQAPVTKQSASAAPASSGSTQSSGDVSKGKAVFGTSCASCHGQNAEGLVGPDLRKVGSTRDRDFLTRWLTNPTAVKKDSTMPAVPLSDADRAAVVDYLLTLK